MAGEKPDVLLVGAMKPVMMKGFEGKVNLHHWLDAKDKDAYAREIGSKVKAIAIAHHTKVDDDFLKQFPNVQQVSSFGVGYDHIDAKWAGEHGIIVTNTPDVLNEEVADTTIGLLLCTLREFPQAERYVRAGKWTGGQYPLTKATLQGRTVGMVGMGRIGRAIARGSVVDEPALIEALKNKTIYSAGLDVFAKEPNVPKELMDMDHVVLFPHLGSASVATREAMDRLVVDNILAWAAGKPPLTPVSETPYSPKRA